MTRSSSRDLRYGRRGGRWASDVPSDRPKLSGEPTVCRYCRSTFSRDVNSRDGCCGRILCRALSDWTATEWAGQARLAEARERAGVELNDLDRHALSRVLRSVPDLQELTS